MSEEKCLMPACQAKAYRRGLCQNCGSKIRKAIKDGKVSEEVLMKKGVLLPKQPTTKKSAVDQFLSTL